MLMSPGGADAFGSMLKRQGAVRGGFNGESKPAPQQGYTNNFGGFNPGMNQPWKGSLGNGGGNLGMPIPNSGPNWRASQDAITGVNASPGFGVGPQGNYGRGSNLPGTNAGPGGSKTAIGQMLMASPPSAPTATNPFDSGNNSSFTPGSGGNPGGIEGGSGDMRPPYDGFQDISGRGDPEILGGPWGPPKPTPTGPTDTFGGGRGAGLPGNGWGPNGPGGMPTGFGGSNGIPIEGGEGDMRPPDITPPGDYHNSYGPPEGINFTGGPTVPGGIDLRSQFPRIGVNYQSPLPEGNPMRMDDPRQRQGWVWGR